MQKYRKRALASLSCAVTTIFFVLAGNSAVAKSCASKEQQNSGLMTADIALARPVGAVATVTGLALFVISSPFSALGGNSQEAWDNLVASPAQYTFKRPLGHFDCEQPPGEQPPNKGQ